ncbi:Trimeric intracellular cation channel type B-A [Trichinella pseudospiralis]|uniref:Trimeric intracellular cation channel type B-A n=2 Tax=Trichinella pseudospiralis TaxID=6337 RepID=A0A0V1DZZ3_TRIPS|nr:Trimeric intracellular cation channel type B-A [Trichinella pseudospiralis]KRY85229.1 Trimeric intracellular cation channel type B-A [Trichinella pseudospiralis]KRZ22444.1 Trimeric intracellular cation channel type B-A [Trichinella pseudospiralis]KRZ36618.1 Trimeric intracellular cation channel type B-A [Trichinella pseudospiralis]
MLEINANLLPELSKKLISLKLYPYFDIAHYIMMTMSVREDLGSGAVVFSRKHPLSCWFSSMLMCFAGFILSNFLLGEPIVTVFMRHSDVLLATTVWYIVFYSPFDIAYKTVKFYPIKLILLISKEIHRTNKVYSAVVHAMQLYPNSYLIMAILGVAKGAGSGIIRTFEQLVRGSWSPLTNEFLRPSLATKSCIVASVIFILEKMNMIPLPHEAVYTVVVSFFIHFKLSSFVLGIHDPFLPFENLFCAIFMGGIWDALNRAVTTSRERRAGLQSSSDQQQNTTLNREVKKEQ